MAFVVEVDSLKEELEEMKSKFSILEKKHRFLSHDDDHIDNKRIKANKLLIYGKKDKKNLLSVVFFWWSNMLLLWTSKTKRIGFCLLPLTLKNMLPIGGWKLCTAKKTI